MLARYTATQSYLSLDRSLTGTPGWCVVRVGCLGGDYKPAAYSSPYHDFRTLVVNSFLLSSDSDPQLLRLSPHNRRILSVQLFVSLWLHILTLRARIQVSLDQMGAPEDSTPHTYMES